MDSVQGMATKATTTNAGPAPTSASLSYRDAGRRAATWAQEDGAGPPLRWALADGEAKMRTLAAVEHAELLAARAEATTSLGVTFWPYAMCEGAAAASQAVDAAATALGASQPSIMQKIPIKNKGLEMQSVASLR